MKPIWLWIALLLSVGVNLGVLATVGTTHLREPARWERGAREERPPVARVADRLGLEGESRDAFILIQNEFFQGMQESRAELEKALRIEEDDDDILRALERNVELALALRREIVSVAARHNPKVARNVEEASTSHLDAVAGVLYPSLGR